MSRLSLVLLIAFVAISTDNLQAEDLKPYFGLMHGHTLSSNGSVAPVDAFKSAKQTGLDFMAITEHNHNEAAGSDGVFLTPPLYNQLKQSARQHTEPGRFLAIAGQDVSTIIAGNYFNSFLADEICDVGTGDVKFTTANFVKMLGGDYFFAPSISFLHEGS